MADAVQKSGLEIARYNEIAALAAKDPAVATKIAEAGAKPTATP